MNRRPFSVLSRCLLATAALTLPGAASLRAADAAPRFTLTDKGLHVQAGPAGTFDLGLPALDDGKPAGPRDVARAADGRSLALKYANGATAELRLESDRRAKITFSRVPPTAKSFRVETMIPTNFGGAGRYAIGGKEIQTFPPEKPAKPFLFQGDADSFTLVHASGAGFVLKAPPYTYQQLQDNREWNWATFAWFGQTPIARDDPAPSFTYALEDLPASLAKRQVLIDRFGQHAGKDFPGKVKNEDELKQDAKTETEYYASLRPPERDPFGGLPGSGEKFGLKKTGFFHVERLDGGRVDDRPADAPRPDGRRPDGRRPAAGAAGERQVLVDPAGNVFFQLGACGVMPGDDYTTTRGREGVYEWLPDYGDATYRAAFRPDEPAVFSFYLANLARKYARPYEPAAYVTRWVRRLRGWGFNSGGAWAFSGAGEKAAADSNVPHVRFLPLAAPALPVKDTWDPFADGLEQTFDAAFARSVAPRAGDPLLIGWFITNEPAIEEVPRVVAGLKGSQYAAKRALAKMLREKYPSLEAFNAAWGTKLASLDDLAEAPLPAAAPAAGEDLRKFFALFLDRRYSLIAAALRKHDPNHLLIGDRWTPATAGNETLVRTAGKYLDVVSVNYYTYAIDPSFLDRVHARSGDKPLLLSEFHFCARDQGLTGGARQVASQVERGLAYRNYVERAAATGYVVGIQWFLALDQAPTGRYFEGYNGEAANTGLVNVADRPYKEFLAEAMKANYGVYDVELGRRQPFAFDDPRFKAGARPGD